MQTAAATSTSTSNHSHLRELVLGYLAERTVLNLATAGPAGLWVSAVLYVNEGTHIYFTSVAATRHGQNMLTTGRVAGTISDECHEWKQMRGLQLDGEVEHVDDFEERRRVIAAYLRRFPFAAGLWNGESNPDVIARNPGIHGFYRITPTRLLYTDNDQLPGGREELPAE